MVKNILHYIDTEIEKHIVSRHKHHHGWALSRAENATQASAFITESNTEAWPLFSIPLNTPTKNTNNYSRRTQVHYLATRLQTCARKRRRLCATDANACTPTSVFTRKVKHLLVRTHTETCRLPRPHTPLMAPSPAMLGSLPVNSTKSPHSF